MADGQDKVALIAVARDAMGAALSGRRVKIAVTGSENQLSAVEAATLANGLAMFVLASTRAEVKVVSVSIDGIALARQAVVAFIAGPPKTLAFTAQPPTGTAGDTLADVAVAAFDAHGNVAKMTAPVTLSLSSGPPGGELIGETVLTPDGDAATFGGLRLQRAGGYALRATSGPLQVDGTRFTVVAGPASTLAFVSSPTGSVTAGAAFGLVIEIRDSFGNVSNSSAPVTATLLGGTLRGPLYTNAVEGVARLNDLSVQEAAPGYVIQASAPGLPSIRTAAFEVVAGSPSQLAFGTQPSDRTAGSSFAPAVTVHATDAFGNLITSGITYVTVTLQGGSAGATLLGTASTAVILGTASFGELTVDRAGAGYTLLARSAGLQDVSSAPFAVSAAGADATNSEVIASPSSAVAGGSVALTATIRDLYGNPVSGEAVTFQSTGSANTLGTAALSDAAGQVTATLSSTRSEAKIITARLADGTAITGSVLHGATGSAAVTFKPAAPSAVTSTLAAAPTAVIADGHSPFALTTTLEDPYGNPVPGVNVTLGTSGSATLAQPPATDAAGRSTGSITSRAAGEQDITASVAGALIAKTSVQFYAPAGIASLTGDTTILKGAAATFTVTATGTPPFVFVWARNGAYIPGSYFWTRGNSSTLTTPPLGEDDNGASYAVTVYNQVASLTSPAWGVDVVEAVPGRHVYTLFSNESEVYPQRSALTMRSLSPSPSGAGVTIGFAGESGGLPTYGFAASAASAVTPNISDATLAVDFSDPTSPDLQTATLTLLPAAPVGSAVSSSLSMRYQSPAWLAAHGQSGPARIALTQGGLPLASPTQVEDWVIGQPSASDIAFAQVTWGGIVAGVGTPTEIAQALGRAIIDELEPHRGVPSDAMNTTPFAQYRRAMSGADQVWCVNINAIFTWACKCFGLPVRTIALGNVSYKGPSYYLETAEGHASAEVFDAGANRWVWIDPTMYQLGARGPGGRLLSLFETQRAVNDPSLLPALTAIEYSPGKAVTEIPLGQSRYLADIKHFLTRASIPAITKASGLRLAREMSSNEFELFPRRNDIALASVRPLESGCGMRLQLVSSLPDLDRFEYELTYDSEGNAAGGVGVSPNGVVDISFDDPHSPAGRARVYSVRAVGTSGAASSQYAVTVRYYSTEFYQAFGQTSAAYVIFDDGGLPAAASAVEDWIVDSPSSDDVAFANATWGAVVDPTAAPAARAGAIAAAILDQVTPAIGVPTDGMIAAAPFEQYGRAVAAVDHLDNRGLSAIFAHACNSLGLPARVVEMGREAAGTVDLAIDAAAQRAAVEVYDDIRGRWVYFDLELGLLGVDQAGVGLLNSAQLTRAAVDSTQIATLTVLAYDASSRIQRVAFESSPAAAFLSGYFKLGPHLRFARNAW
ncbi:hypothetical protein AMYX_01800 [Anaeromyxobacter diazotrophicus]|uniref:Uncharacterized protein n=1 Tax=Anaeromyxobacter diazotrophicus TaxID=2590199 RepID=A0A7I9VGS0_9BACT|nr:hypothetical protein AMYX_01800 [Anaeromyxobacter diazotrophicus]